MLFYEWVDRTFIKPPYRGWPAAVFLIVMVFACFAPTSPIQTFHLNDPDDTMRLVMMLEWLQGQSWYDLSQPRLSPGLHTVLPWSRLVDVPLAVIAKPLMKITDARNAALIAALIVPLASLGLLLKLLPALARPFLDKARARLVVLLLPLTGMGFLLPHFLPGSVDHHGYTILLAGVGLMAAPRILLCRGGWKTGVAAGIAFAIGLWIGVEILPPLLVVLCGLALGAALRGGFAARNVALFGGAFAVATALVLPAALPVAAWNSRAISWFSPAYVLFAALTGGVLILGWLAGRATASQTLRVGLMLALGFFAATLFIEQVPDVLAGPFANYDAFNRNEALDHISEARPIWKDLRFIPSDPLTWLKPLATFFKLLFLPLVATSLCLFMAATARPRARLIWSLTGLILFSTLILALLCQVRVVWFTLLFQIGPLGFIIWKVWDRFHATWPLWTRYRATLLTFCGLALVPLVITFEIHNLTTNEAAPPTTCNVRPALFAIDFRLTVKDQPFTILTGMDEAPDVLFYTPHNVIGGFFNVAGNTDVLTFFKSSDDAEALTILNRWHVDLVLVCKNSPPFYAGQDLSNPHFGIDAFLRTGQDGKLHIVTNPDHPALIERLKDGHVPAWLKQVELPATNDYLLYKVKKNEIQK